MLCVRQIIASASNAYDIPWPSNFNSFLSTLRIFLVDVVSITRTSCAQPMNYYASLATVLVGVKVVLLLMLLGPWREDQAAQVVRVYRAAAPTRHPAKGACPPRVRPVAGVYDGGGMRVVIQVACYLIPLPLHGPGERDGGPAASAGSTAGQRHP